MAAQPTQPAGEGMADAEALAAIRFEFDFCKRMSMPRQDERDAALRHVQSVIAERDALRQACWHARAIMGFDNAGDPTPAALSYPPLAQLIVDNAHEFGRDYDEVSTDRDRLAARCEGLESALNAIVDASFHNYGGLPKRTNWKRMNPGLRAAIEQGIAGLSPPASDADGSEPLAAGVA